MSTAFHIIKAATALKITSDVKLSDQEALYCALYNYNPFLAQRVQGSDFDPRNNIDRFLYWLLDNFKPATP